MTQTERPLIGWIREAYGDTTADHWLEVCDNLGLDTYEDIKEDDSR